MSESKIKGSSLYISGGILVLAYVMLFTQTLTKIHIQPQMLLGYIFWTSVFFYYWWKYRSKNQWTGAFIGFVIGVVAINLAGFIVGIKGG